MQSDPCTDRLAKSPETVNIRQAESLLWPDRLRTAMLLGPEKRFNTLIISGLHFIMNSPEAWTRSRTSGHGLTGGRRG